LPDGGGEALEFNEEDDRGAADGGRLGVKGVFPKNLCHIECLNANKKY